MRVEIGPYEENRKIDIHIDKWDTWGMDHTLSLIILPMLIQLRDTNHGHPAQITEEEWIEIQNKMIWSFEEIMKDDFNFDKEHNEKIQEGLNLFGKWFRDLWD